MATKLEGRVTEMEKCFAVAMETSREVSRILHRHDGILMGDGDRPGMVIAVDRLMQEHRRRRKLHWLTLGAIFTIGASAFTSLAAIVWQHVQ